MIHAGRLAAGLTIALALGLLPAPADAQTKIPLTREQALTEIKSEDLELRRRAAAWLGELGGPADAPALLGVLADPDEVVRVLAEHSVWQVWSRSGDKDIDGQFQVGVEQMSRGDGDAAVETFTRIIQRKPDFAEAWNKRATLYFLMGENEKSLHDCDEVMKRNPYHFGALSGYALIYIRLEYYDRALEYSRRALEVNPNIDGVRRNIDLLERLLEQRRGRMI